MRGQTSETSSGHVTVLWSNCQQGRQLRGRRTGQACRQLQMTSFSEVSYLGQRLGWLTSRSRVYTLEAGLCLWSSLLLKYAQVMCTRAHGNESLGSLDPSYFFACSLNYLIFAKTLDCVESKIKMFKKKKKTRRHNRNNCPLVIHGICKYQFLNPGQRQWQKRMRY